MLDAVAPGMAAFDEETFGPAAAVIRAANADEAIRLANTSCFGLGASLWTEDRARGERKTRLRRSKGGIRMNLALTGAAAALAVGPQALVVLRVYARRPSLAQRPAPRASRTAST